MNEISIIPKNLHKSKTYTKPTKCFTVSVPRRHFIVSLISEQAIHRNCQHWLEVQGECIVPKHECQTLELATNVVFFLIFPNTLSYL